MLGSLADTAGLTKKVNPTIWRPTFATRMILAEGIDVISEREIIGHRSFAMLLQHFSHDAGTKLMGLLLMAEEHGE